MIDVYEVFFFAYCLEEEGMSRERKERREGTKRGDTPPFYNETRSVFFSSILVYILSCHFITLHLF